MQFANMTSFHHSTISSDESFRAPLKNLDLNDSDDFLRLKKTTGNEIRNHCENDYRENYADKLPVLHRGVHGEQLGTLIARHYVRKDSKCIQCRNCGIFFSVSSFLQHCHDQFGKRMTCNAHQIQSGLENPSNQQKSAWNEFQKKIHTDGALSHREKDGSKQQSKHLHRSTAVTSSRRKPLMFEAPQTRYFEKPTKSLQASEKKTLYNSKKFPSSSAIDVVNSDTFSISEMNAAMNKKFTKSYNLEKLSYTGVNSPNPLNSTTHYNDFPSKYSHKISAIGRQSPPASIIGQHTIAHANNSHLASVEDISTIPNSREISSTQQLESISYSSKNIQLKAFASSTTANDPKKLINQASILLQQASDNLATQPGQNSNAWRKMYEEERDHRMTLEAKVRDLERELWNIKKSNLIGD